MKNCIFCKIANGEIPSTRVYENDFCFAINDLHPKAPRHILLIPKVHVEKFADLDDENLAGELFKAIHTITKQENISHYQLHVNNGARAGQEVMHLHIHIMGY
ncbi:HIT domain-containing protein [bacterium]|nr:HIT domain-containing protein [bacterium]